MKILAVGCHPDDIEVSCVGILTKYSRNGHNVVMRHTANGNMGHKLIMHDEPRFIRREELRNQLK